MSILIGLLGLTTVVVALVFLLDSYGLIPAIDSIISNIDDRWRVPTVMGCFGLSILVAAVTVTKRPDAQIRPVGVVLLIGALLVILATTGGMLVWLLSIASNAPAATQSTTQIDAIRTALATAAGTGGAFGLLLAFRRQRTAEITGRGQNSDLIERRITELYGRAVDQLGNDRAAVRLAALYSLERLAQKNPEQRQVIADVICAYLRMPHEASGTAVRSIRSTSYGGRTKPESRREDEREVRLTAQRILLKHVSFKDRDYYRGIDEFWPDISLDLSGAYLEEFVLVSSEVKDLILSRAKVNGDVDIRRCRVRGRLDLGEMLVTGTVGIGQSIIVEDCFMIGGRCKQLVVVDSVFKDQLRVSKCTMNSLSAWDVCARSFTLFDQRLPELRLATFTCLSISLHKFETSNMSFTKSKIRGEFQLIDAKILGESHMQDISVRDWHDVYGTSTIGAKVERVTLRSTPNATYSGYLSKGLQASARRTFFGRTVFDVRTERGVD